MDIETTVKRHRTMKPIEFYKDYKCCESASHFLSMLSLFRDHSIPNIDFLANHSLLGHVKKRFYDKSDISRKRLAESLVEARVKPTPYIGSTDTFLRLALVFCLPDSSNKLAMLGGSSSPFDGQYHDYTNGGLVVVFTTAISRLDSPTKLEFRTREQKDRYRLGLNSPMPITCTQTYPCRHERNFRLLSYLSSDLGLPRDSVEMIARDVFKTRAERYRELSICQLGQ